MAYREGRKGSGTSAIANTVLALTQVGVSNEAVANLPAMGLTHL